MRTKQMVSIRKFHRHDFINCAVCGKPTEMGVCDGCYSDRIWSSRNV